jgi:hypothetical protein
VQNDDSTPNENKQAEERDEMDDLDVSQQQAEDVKGGVRAGRFPKKGL